MFMTPAMASAPAERGEANMQCKTGSRPVKSNIFGFQGFDVATRSIGELQHAIQYKLQRWTSNMYDVKIHKKIKHQGSASAFGDLFTYMFNRGTFDLLISVHAFQKYTLRIFNNFSKFSPSLIKILQDQCRNQNKLKSAKTFAITSQGF